MNPIIKNILALITGILVGSTVNMALILVSSHIIPFPEGFDNTTSEGLKTGMHLMEPKHFIFPFFAHALGTLVGAFLTSIIAATHKMLLALSIGILFLIGGIMMVMQLPSPMWFNLLDLIGAYIPMAYIGAKLVKSK
jgi:hypothetical protein